MLLLSSPAADVDCLELGACWPEQLRERRSSEGSLIGETRERRREEGDGRRATTTGGGRREEGDGRRETGPSWRER
ncbi:hypothetical protein KY285_010231 [Solanum tuberosum]|nr:hypothetical protein KY289_010767 [Solanum tuberosum]KAH0734524.1 hypothetical protein KY285_010231 [Solanum tuberosum]